MALWLYATVEGVSSARALDRLCDEHVVYQWICGGVGVNYHPLSDFRAQNSDVLDELLTQSVAALMKEGIVDLARVAQDRLERVKRALARTEKLEKEKATRKEKQGGRVSTTDPDARVMKMGETRLSKQCPSPRDRAFILRRRHRRSPLRWQLSGVDGLSYFEGCTRPICSSVPAAKA